MFVAKVICFWSAGSTSYQAFILDSVCTSELKHTERFVSPLFSAVRWQNDSILEIIDPYLDKMNIVHPDMSISDSTGPVCRKPATSSSAFCSGKGFVGFASSCACITFNSNTTDSNGWCFK
jgi:hypothetical protein